MTVEGRKHDLQETESIVRLIRFFCVFFLVSAASVLFTSFIRAETKDPPPTLQSARSASGGKSRASEELAKLKEYPSAKRIQLEPAARTADLLPDSKRLSPKMLSSRFKDKAFIENIKIAPPSPSPSPVPRGERGRNVINLKSSGLKLSTKVAQVSSSKPKTFAQALTHGWLVKEVKPPKPRESILEATLNDPDQYRFKGKEKEEEDEFTTIKRLGASR